LPFRRSRCARACRAHARADRGRRRRCLMKVRTNRTKRSRALAAVLALAAAGCGPQADPGFVGVLEWDRIAVAAELAEPVLRWAVEEGERVRAGQVLLELDASRQDARIAQARAALAQAEARLAELTRGARAETIQAARANLARARAAQVDAEAEY